MLATACTVRSSHEQAPFPISGLLKPSLTCQIVQQDVCVNRDGDVGNRLALVMTAVILTGCASVGRDVNAFSLLGLGGSDLATTPEVPPEGFTGDYWTDSNGCAFIRAGNGEQQRWVPQVNAKRQQICNPDLARPAAASQPTAPAAPITAMEEMIDPNTGLKTVVLAPITIAPSFLRIGTYTDPNEAEDARTAFRNMGFRIVGDGADVPSTVAKTVTLGPFTTASALEDAKQVAEELGYPKAYAYSNL